MVDACDAKVTIAGDGGGKVCQADRRYSDIVEFQPFPCPLVIYEEKRAIFVNWSAQRSAELVASIRRRLFEIKKVPCVERAVGVVAVSRSVELIVAGARDSRNDGPGGAAILRVARPRCDSQLAHRLNARIVLEAGASGRTVGMVVDVGAIEKEGIGVAAPAGRGETRAGAELEAAETRAGSIGDDSRHERYQRIIAPAQQRQFPDGARRNNCTQ